MKKIVQFFIGALSVILMAASVGFAGQGPNAVYPAVNTSGYGAPQQLDAQGNVKVNGDGWLSSLNISASGVVKATAGAIVRISVTTAGSTPGSVYDAATTGTASAANLIAVMPNTVGVTYLNWPVTNGIVISPGASQVVSVSYE